MSQKSSLPQVIQFVSEALMPDKLIKQRRKALGLTQTDLAAKLNTSGATINRWENGKRGVQASDLDRIAAALQSTSAELVRQEEVKVTPSPEHDVDPLLLAAWKRLDRKSRKQLVQFALIMAGEAS
jgi:transcriptional regulator with XRE-family HTH domain